MVTTNLTITEIARQLGLSKTTVSRVVNNTPNARISQTTRRRVLEEVQRMGYRPSMAAQRLGSARTNLLGLILPIIGGSFEYHVRGVERAARDHTYNIILCSTDFERERERQYIDMLIRRRVEGVIFYGPHITKGQEFDHIMELVSLQIPVVMVGHGIPEDYFSSVVADNLGDAKRVTNHLICQGHKRIGYFHCGDIKEDTSTEERFEGYRQALAENGLPYVESLVQKVAEITVDDQESLLSEIIESYLLRPDRPGAIFANHDMLAVKAMRLAQKLHLKLPQDLAFAGIDDVLAAANITPALTTVRQPGYAIGCRAVELLVNRIQKENMEWPVHERLGGKLIIRESCSNAVSDIVSADRQI